MLSWFEQHPDRARATRQYLERMQSFSDPLMMWLKGLPTLADQIRWLWLSVLLAQGLPVYLILPVVQSFYEAWPGQRLLQRPFPTEKEIRRLVAQRIASTQWTLFDSVPGILLSWSRFFCRRPEIEAWLAEYGDAGVWRSARWLYFMGKENPVRPKVLELLYRLCAPVPFGLGLTLPQKGKRSYPFPVTPGLRRWQKVLGSSRNRWLQQASEKEQVQFFQTLYQAFHGNDQSVWATVQGFRFFLEPISKDWMACQEWIGCAQCPLVSWCPRGRFL